MQWTRAWESGGDIFSLSHSLNLRKGWASFHSCPQNIAVHPVNIDIFRSFSLPPQAIVLYRYILEGLTCVFLISDGAGCLFIFIYMWAFLFLSSSPKLFPAFLVDLLPFMDM